MRTQVPPAVPAAARRAPLRYLPGIDGLRAISVLAVLAYHHYDLGWGSFGPFPGGFMGVEVFFVISGYLITALLLAERRQTSRVSLRRFWLRRARRLLPALYLLLAAVVLFVLLPGSPWRDALESLKSDVVAALTYTSNWWQIAADRSYLAEAGRPPLLKHLWSLAIEEQFYLLWPPLLMLGLLRLGRRRTLLLMAATVLASTLLLAVARGSDPNVDPSPAYYATFTRLSGLLLGGMLAFVWAPHLIRRPPGRATRPLLNVVGLVAAYVLWRSFRTMHFDEIGTFRGGFLLVDLATVVLIAVTVHPASDWRRVLGMRPLRWVGMRSYAIYLWHYPIFAVTRPDGLDNDWWWGSVVLVRFGLTFGLAALSFRWVEAPIRAGAIGRYVERLRDARGPRRRRLATRGIAVAGAVSVAAVLVGGSLANAEPDVPRVHGIDARADDNEAGDEADPAALAAFTSSTTPPTTPTTVAAATTVPEPDTTTVPTTVPPTTVPPIPPGVLGVGDSVMLGAKQELQQTVPGMIVDAVVSRQFAHAIAVLQQYRDFNALPQVVVVHLGTNGRWVGPELDHLIEVIGPERDVYFLTARMPRSWEAEVNQKLREGTGRHPNATLLEWREYGGCHHDWFAHDGFHVTDVGAQEYANFVNAHLSGQAGGLTYCQ